MPLFGPNIKKMEKTGDVAGLMATIKHQNPKIRLKAIESLSRISGSGNLSQVVETGGVEALIDILEKDANAAMRSNAAHILEEIAVLGESEKTIILVLIKALNDSDKKVRWEVLFWLTDFAFQRGAKKVVEAGAVPEIVKALHDSEGFVRAQAAESLAIISWDDPDIVVEHGGVKALIKALKGEEIYPDSWNTEDILRWQTAAADELGSIIAGIDDKNEVKTGVQVLLKTLKNSKESELRQEIAKSLNAAIWSGGHIDSVVECGGLPILLEAFRSDNAKTCGFAAWPLIEIANAGIESDLILSELKEALETRETQIRKGIIEAMGLVGGTWMTSTLEDLLKRERNKEVVKAACEAIERIKDGKRNP